MSVFNLYLSLGLSHIADIQGYDHILFILTLCGIYVIKQWKHVLILVTAFTVGHSLTLVLATFDVISISSGLVEFLIPVTIFITAVGNITHKKVEFSRNLHLFKYFTALFFGLIHGLGFSNYLKSLLLGEDNLTLPLFAFNVGIELGQILIVLAILLLAELFVHAFGTKRREWNLVISGMGLGISLILIIERLPN